MSMTSLHFIPHYTTRLHRYTVSQKTEPVFTVYRKKASIEYLTPWSGRLTLTFVSDEPEAIKLPHG